MNLDTLESRLSNFLRRASMNNHNQQYPQLVNSSPIGTMIPTPGMSHVPNSSMMVASSMDASVISASGRNSIASTSFNSVNMLPAGGMLGSTLNRFDGNIGVIILHQSFFFSFLVLHCRVYVLQVCLMVISSLLPVFLLPRGGAFHQWGCRELLAR